MSSDAAANNDEKLVWYFAYGSNMLAAKFTGGRGIKPLKAMNVRTPGWILSLDIPGMPYQEPTFLSLQRREEAPAAPPARIADSSTRLEKSSSTCGNEAPDAVGVAYLITDEQYIQVIGSEGGGIAYVDVAIPAVSVDPGQTESVTKLVTDGAEESHLPQDYQTYLHDIATYELPRSKLGKAGAAVFVGFWGPIMGMMEKITHATIGKDGYCPSFVIWMVRLTMISIWLTHDIFFAPLIGRGDGNEKRRVGPIDEETPLLEKPDR